MDSNRITNHEIWKRLKLGKTATALLDKKAKKKKKLNCKEILQTVIGPSSDDRRFLLRSTKVNLGNLTIIRR